MRNALLSASGLVAGYPPETDTLNDVSIAVAENEIVTVVGANGAGKSTLFKAIAGLLPLRSGSITLCSLEMAGRPASVFVEHGLGYVPQRDSVFETLSVKENLEIGLMSRPDLPLTQRMDAMYAIFPHLGERRRQIAGSLSGGERQMLAIARALMPEPKVLLLDEPTAGLAPRLIEYMFEQVLAINRSGVAILMIEQRVTAALMMSDRGYVLHLGRNAREGDGPALAQDPTVPETYFESLRNR